MTHSRPQSFFSLLLISLTIGFVGCNKSNEEPVSRAAKGEVPTAKRLEMIVSADELSDRLSDKNLLILDARSQADYEKGHLPAAVHVDVNAWKTQALKETGKGLKDQQTWTTMVRQLGINNNSQVVVYAGARPLSATRIWWTLRYLGVEDASLLDGGWPAWKEIEADSSTVVPAVNKGNFDVDFQKNRSAPIDWVKENCKKDSIAMMDARSAEEFALHVPGATRLEWSELLDDKGKLKPVAELQKLFSQKGFANDKETVVYCKTGGRASLNVFALELAGYEKVRSYYPGWSLWGSDESTPKEKVKPKGKK